jgi:hypothetical protein
MVQPLETGTPDEQFENLRQRFRERMKAEQRQLATLNKALGSADIAEISIFLDIKEFAHRLRGAALVFGFQGLGDEARAVELAATAASLHANREPRNPSVITAMQALTTTLAAQIDAGAMILNSVERI